MTFGTRLIGVMNFLVMLAHLAGGEYQDAAFNLVIIAICAVTEFVTPKND